MRLRCNTCGGEYDELMPDGLRYFHKCPPVVYAVVVRNKEKVAVPQADVAKDEPIVDYLYIDRPNARDENVVQIRDEHDTFVSVAKANGAGVTPIAAVNDVKMPARDGL